MANSLDMNTKKLFFVFFACLAFPAFAQKPDYAVMQISDSLKLNANAIVRSDVTDIVIASQRKMTIRTSQVIAVFNELGMNAVFPVEHYDKRTTIKSIEAKIYNAFGKEIRQFKKGDFRDQSASGGGTLFSDNRLLYLSYTPTEYPFTLVYECEVETSNTAFIPQWFALNRYNISVEKSTLNVTYPENLGFKKKERNFNNHNITKTTDTPTQLAYTATLLYAKKAEDYSPAFSDIFPYLMMGLESFHLEGIDGKASSWKEFGQWYSGMLLTGTLDLPEKTISQVKALVGDEKDPVKKAKIVYDFVQQKSRYVSIQVGIGGWKPMLAADVDRLGYGDCKGLTNYTKALLAAVDVPSYNTIIYGGDRKQDIVTDFVAMQGNHMILSIPQGDRYIWLECTSQEDPFGYQGTFTDDRYCIVIKPEGGEVVKTHLYEDINNKQAVQAKYALSDNGGFSGNVSIVSEGTQYADKYRITGFSPADQDKYYKNLWDNINNLKILKKGFSNKKEEVKFIDNVDISAANYATISANRMLFTVNAYSQNGVSVKKSRNRKAAFEIQRGFYDTDETEISLPPGYTIEAMPDNFELRSKYGEYKTELVKKDDKTVIYKRTMYMKSGSYANTDYEDFRLFNEKIARNDNAKIVLIKNE